MCPRNRSHFKRPSRPYRACSFAAALLATIEGTARRNTTSSPRDAPSRAGACDMMRLRMSSTLGLDRDWKRTVQMPACSRRASRSWSCSVSAFCHPVRSRPRSRSVCRIPSSRRAAAQNTKPVAVRLFYVPAGRFKANWATESCRTPGRRAMAC